MITEDNSNIFDNMYVSPVQRIERNAHGRDFVVGDIHGMFAHLRMLLAEIAFDPLVDRLFSVGDLVDRGDDSRQAREWLALPWFFACRGNHEQLAIDSVDPESLELWVQFNGGEWWLDLSVEEHSQFRDIFINLPLALEVATATGPVGVVHADVPALVDWDQFMRLLELHTQDAAIYAMWSRNRVQGSITTGPVPGRVDRVYCGHTPVRQVVRLDNVWFIDTGAPYYREGYVDARLTVVEIHPRRHHEFSINTNRPAAVESGLAVP